MADKLKTFFQPTCDFNNRETYLGGFNVPLDHINLTENQAKAALFALMVMLGHPLLNGCKDFMLTTRWQNTPDAKHLWEGQILAAQMMQVPDSPFVKSLIEEYEKIYAKPSEQAEKPTDTV